MIDAELWRRLRDLAPDEVTERSGATLTAEEHYELPVLGSRVGVNAQTEEVTSSWPEVIPVDYFLAVSAIQYLISAKKGERADELISPRQLAYGEVFFRGPHALPGDALGALFSADGARFRQVLGQLGGLPTELGDVGMRVSVFPKIPISLGLWLADDEFPARVTFLFDRTAGDHLPLDALWSAAMVLAGAVRRLAALPQE